MFYDSWISKILNKMYLINLEIKEKGQKGKINTIKENSHAVRGSTCDLIGLAGAGQQYT